MSGKQNTNNNSNNTKNNKMYIIPDVGGHIPEDKDQVRVNTPYGEGLVIRTRRLRQSSPQKAIQTQQSQQIQPIYYEIELQSWLSNHIGTKRIRKPPMLYTTIQYPSVQPQVGNEVTCLFGRGKVIDIRTTVLWNHNNDKENDTINTNTSHDTTTPNAIVGTSKSHNGQLENVVHDDYNNKATDRNDDNNNTVNHVGTVVVVQLSSWRLAKRCTVTCYLQVSAIQVVRTKKIYEMNIYERIERATQLKVDATQLFIKKQYESALATYALAVDAVRYVQHTPDHTNYIRADLLILMITCCNNAATCCTKLKNKWNEASKHATSALMLLDALLEKTTSSTSTKTTVSTNNGIGNGTTLSAISNSKIHIVLNEDGYTDVKLFGEWRVKSLLVLATCYYEVGKYDESIDCIKKGRDIVDIYNTIAKETIVKVKGSSSTPINHNTSSITNQNVNDLNSTSTSSTTASTTTSASTNTKNSTFNKCNTDYIHSLQSSQKQLDSLDKELIKLLRTCKEKKKKILEKEKLRAQAMFSSSSSSTTSTSTSTSTTTSTVPSTSSSSTNTNNHDNYTDKAKIIPNGSSLHKDNNSDDDHAFTSTTKTTTKTKNTGTTMVIEPQLSPSGSVKKKVTFSETVQSREIHYDTTKNNTKDILYEINDKSDSNNNNNEDDGWDSEAVLGLLMLGGFIVLGVAATYLVAFGKTRAK